MGNLNCTSFKITQPDGVVRYYRFILHCVLSCIFLSIYLPVPIKIHCLIIQLMFCTPSRLSFRIFIKGGGGRKCDNCRSKRGRGYIKYFKCLLASSYGISNFLVYMHHAHPFLIVYYIEELVMA